MENNPNMISSKKIKILITSIIIFCIAVLTIFISILIYHFPSTTIYKVEYVKSLNDVIVQTYYKGEKITFPDTPIKAGYEFVGWSLDKNENNFLTQEITVEKELILYAKWKEQNYTLTYNGNNFTLTYNSTISYNEDNLLIESTNGLVSIPNPSINEYRFIEWKISDGINTYDIKDFSFDKIKDTNLVLIPIFEDLFVNFKIIGNNNSFIINNLSHTNKIEIGTPLTFEFVLNENVNKSNVNFNLDNGKISVEKFEDKYLICVTDFEDDFEIKINNIELNKYTVTFNNENESIAENYEYGSQLCLPSFTKLGYKLVGFKDAQNRYYSNDYIVTSDLSLIAVWEEELYEIKIPKSNGNFIINLDNEFLTLGKVLYKKYNQSITFNVELSDAYNQSTIQVYAYSSNGIINPEIIDNQFIFNNIYCNMEIIIDNVVLNTYSINIDGTNYGKFTYGSWIFVDHDIICIKDNVTNKEIQINTLINDENFAGWYLDNKILLNSTIQDIANKDNIVIITGKYSVKIAKITLIANGGILDTTEIIFIEGEEISLPIPTKDGYNFAGWYTKLVEINTIVDENLSTKFVNIDNLTMVLYAGWSK